MKHRNSHSNAVKSGKKPSSSDNLLMILSEFVCGTTVDALEKDVVLLETTRRSQSVRTRQSLLSLALVSVVSVGYLWALWGSSNPLLLIVWTCAIVFGTAWRSVISYKVHSTLPTASAQQLVKNESELVFTGIAIPFTIGAGYWLLCVPGDERTTLAVALLSCMYGVGSTVNTVAQKRMLTFMVVLNLGQGVLFFATRGIAVDYAVAIQLMALTFLLLGFGNRFEQMFVELVKSDLEIKYKNKALTQNRFEIEAALSEAVKANKSKSQFLAAASHDLSQPLHAMSMFIGNLKQSVESEKQQDLVSKIENTAEILQQQFDGLLDLSRYDAGGVTVQKQSFDLHALCNLLVESEMPLAAEKNLQLVLRGESVTVNTDPVLLGRLIGNLIANAIKFTEAGTVEVEVFEQDGNVQLRVADTGCGFTENEQERIFKDFVQLSNPARNRKKGVGLGLSIVKRISALLDVDVSVKSVVGQGAEFTLKFPEDNRVVTSMHTERSSSAVAYLESIAEDIKAESIDLTGFNILLVDDDPNILDGLKSYINSRDGNALVATGYKEALKFAESGEVDFCIVDDMLCEEHSGLDLARRLSNDIAIKRVIIVTGNILPKRIEVLRSSGFGFYSKPLSVARLDEIIGERLDLGRSAPAVFLPKA